MEFSTATASVDAAAAVGSQCYAAGNHIGAAAAWTDALGWCDACSEEDKQQRAATLYSNRNVTADISICMSSTTQYVCVLAYW